MYFIQDVVNSVENIAKKFRGRVCIDIAGQHLIPFSKREEIFKHIEGVIKLLNTDRGGLAIHIDVYPQTPLSDIEHQQMLVIDMPLT